MTDLQIESFDSAIKHLSATRSLIWTEAQRLSFIHSLKKSTSPDSKLSLESIQFLLKAESSSVEFTNQFIADEYPLNADPSDLYLQVFAAIALLEEV